MKNFFSSVDFSNPDNVQALSGEVHLWLLDLTKFGESDIAQAKGLLSVQELQRAESFKRRKSEHILTRAFVRKILALYCQCSAEEVSFAVDMHGKPYLTNHFAPVAFNLSHSGNFAVLAVSLKKRLGVDIEVARQRNFMKIAEHYFHPRETHALTHAPADQQLNLFFELWTRKEAFFKALGGGIATGLDKINFDTSQQPWTFYFADSLGEQADEWQILANCFNEQIFISLAVEQTSPLILHWFDGSRLFADQ